MHIRLLTRDDISVCADITGAAFIDNLFFAFLAPHRHAYPDAWRKFHLERLRRRCVTPGTWGVVCVEKSSTGEEEILGYGVWMRQTVEPNTSNPSKYLTNHTGMAARFERLLLDIEDKYHDFVGNPAMSRSALKMIRGGPPPTSGFSSVPDRWYLANLCITPEHQRRGIGGMLVDWGLERCREEKPQASGAPLPAGLIASPAGLGLYKKRGFKVAGWKTIPNIDEAGAEMVWDRECTWVRVLGEEDGVVLEEGFPVEVVYRNTRNEEIVVEKREEVVDQVVSRESEEVVLPVDEAESMAIATSAIRDMAT